MFICATSIYQGELTSCKKLTSLFSCTIVDRYRVEKPIPTEAINLTSLYSRVKLFQLAIYNTEINVEIHIYFN